MTLPCAPRPIAILLVEDNPGDARLVREALKSAGIDSLLTVARDGEEALDLLRGIRPAGEAVRPDLILLDLNLPRKDGRELLAEIKQDPSLQRIPVVVLTSSAAAQDVRTAYELQANSYIVKQVSLEEFTKAIASIYHFWLSLVTLPPPA
jgi:chemotaxis family two-component system response regulator Rcp1